MKYLYYDTPRPVTGSENAEAYAAFMQRAEEYDKQYQKIKGAFSKGFNELYEKTGFHDASPVCFENLIGKNNTLRLTLSHQGKLFEFTYKNVRYCRYEVFHKDTPQQWVLDYEILPAEDGCFSHEFSLAPDNGSILIVAKKTVFKRLSTMNR
jgi:hypothetical protein